MFSYFILLYYNINIYLHCYFHNNYVKNESCVKGPNVFFYHCCAYYLAYIHLDGNAFVELNFICVQVHPVSMFFSSLF